jgi:hypothetical protein
VKNILEGTTGMHPANCDDQFKKIVHCMAGEKNARILTLYQTGQFINFE